MVYEIFYKDNHNNGEYITDFEAPEYKITTDTRLMDKARQFLKDTINDCCIIQGVFKK